MKIYGALIACCSDRLISCGKYMTSPTVDLCPATNNNMYVLWGSNIVNRVRCTHVHGQIIALATHRCYYKGNVIKRVLLKAVSSCRLHWYHCRQISEKESLGF